MGLAMYLNRKTYIWTDWQDGPNRGKRELSELKMPEKYNFIKPERMANHLPNQQS